MLPWPLGLAPVGAIPASEEVLLALLRLQGEGGYPSGDDSARVRELMAHAIQLGLGVGGLDAAYYSIFPSLGLEMLEDHERAMQAPNDAARTIEERQQRLRAFLAARRLGKDLSFAQLCDLAGLTVTPALAVAAGVADRLLDVDAPLSTGLNLDAAQWTTKARRMLVSLARRTMPVAAYGQKHFATAEEVLRSTDVATWGGSEILGRAALSNDGSSGVTQRAPSRTRSYAGTEAIRARDLNRMQRAILMGPAEGADNDLSLAPFDGGILRAFSISIASTTAAQIITGDVRNRLYRVWLLHSASDVRPGQAGDTTLNAATMFTGIGYTGDGSGSFVLTLPSSTSSYLQGNATGFEIFNNAGAAKRFVGIIELSPVVTDVGANIEITDERTLDEEDVDAAWAARIRSAAMRAADGAGVDAWTAFPSSGYGGLVRAGVLAISRRPVSGANAFYIDRTVDWRDRLVAILPIFHDGAGTPNFPGTNGDDAIDGAAFYVGYTGDGEATGGGTGGYHIEIGTAFTMFAASGGDESGALYIEHRSTSSVQTLCAGFIVIASDQLGKRSSATAPTNPAATVDTDPIQAFELNWLQDLSVCSQVRGKPRRAGASPLASTPSDAMPLGPIVRGTPPVPVSWQLKGRDGLRLYRFVGTQRVYTDEVRQPAAAGRLRRYFACSIPNGGTIALDEVADWRDRMLMGVFAIDPTDIRPGGAAEAAINDTTNHATKSSYLGTGWNGVSGGGGVGEAYAMVVIANLIIWTDIATGYLYAKNTTGSTQRIVGVLDASFPLGPRHPVHA